MGPLQIPTQLVTVINLMVRTSKTVYQLPRFDKIQRVIGHLPSTSFLCGPLTWYLALNIYFRKETSVTVENDGVKVSNRLIQVKKVTMDLLI